VLSIARQIGDQVREDEALITYGTLAYWQGNYEQAIDYYEQGIALGEEIGYHYQNLWAYIYMAYALLRQGELQKARQGFVDGIRGMQKADLVIGMVFAAEGLASLHVQQGRMERAAQLFAWANGMRAKLGDPRPPIEQASVESDLVVVRSRLNDSEFASLSSEGQRLTVEDAVRLALGE